MFPRFPTPPPLRRTAASAPKEQSSRWPVCNPIVFLPLSVLAKCEFIVFFTTGLSGQEFIEFATGTGAWVWRQGRS